MKTPNDLFERFGPPVEKHYVSLGHACTLLNVTPGQLYVLMEDADVRFDEVRDGILYMSGEAMQRVVDAYKSVTAEIESIRQAAANN